MYDYNNITYFSHTYFSQTTGLLLDTRYSHVITYEG